MRLTNKSLEVNTFFQYKIASSKCKHKHNTTVLSVTVQISTVYIKLYQAIYNNSLTSVNDKCIFEITEADKRDCSTLNVRKAADGCMLVVMVQWSTGGQKRESVCVCVWGGGGVRERRGLK